MKKIFGILLILLGIFLSFIIFLVAIQLLLNEEASDMQLGGAHAFGYVLGKFIGVTISVTLNFTLYFFGFRLLKKKRKESLIPDEDFPAQLPKNL